MLGMFDLEVQAGYGPPKAGIEEHYDPLVSDRAGVIINVIKSVKEITQGIVQRSFKNQ